MKLESQLFCLYFSPVVALTLLSFGFYALLFNQLKSIIAEQEESIFLEQQTSKKQILLGLKAHLDQSFSLQSQEYYVLSSFTQKIFNNEITFNTNFVPPLLNLERLSKGQEDPILTSIYQTDAILTTIWVEGAANYKSELSAGEQDRLNKAAVLDVLVRCFNLLNGQRTFRYNDQFIGFNEDKLLTANPAFPDSMNESFKYQSLCPGALIYDPTCRTWFRQASKSPRNNAIPFNGSFSPIASPL